MAKKKPVKKPIAKPADSSDPVQPPTGPKP